MTWFSLPNSSMEVSIHAFPPDRWETQGSEKWVCSVIHLVNSYQLFSFSNMDKTLQIDLVKLRFKTQSIRFQNPHFLHYIILSPGNIELQHVFLTLMSYSDNSSVSYMSEWVSVCVCVRACVWERVSIGLGIVVSTFMVKKRYRPDTTRKQNTKSNMGNVPSIIKELLIWLLSTVLDSASPGELLVETTS